MSTVSLDPQEMGAVLTEEVSSPERAERARSAARSARRSRWPLFALGWLFFGVGLVGALLPVLPTTPFMLLALWAFSRSSRRFHRWLYNHRLFGSALQRWERDRVIPLRAKVIAFAAMTTSLLYVGLVVQPPWYGLVGMAAVMVVGVLYISRYPSRR